MLRRSGRRWINPGIEVLRHQRVLEPLRRPIQHRRDHLGIHVVADLTVPDPELDELKGAVGVLAPHEPVDRAAETELRVVPSDHRQPVRHGIGADGLLRALEPPVQRVPETSANDLLRSIQPRGQHLHRVLIRREEQALFGAEVEEHRPLRHPDLVRDVLDVRRPIPMLGEPVHRGIDDPAPSLVRLRRSLDPTLGHRGQTVAHEKEPEGPSLTSRRSVRLPSVPRAQLPRAASALGRESGSPADGSPRGALPPSSPPDPPFGLAAVPRSRWTGLGPRGPRRSRATDHRRSVSRRPCGPLAEPCGLRQRRELLPG